MPSIPVAVGPRACSGCGSPTTAFTRPLPPARCRSRRVRGSSTGCRARRSGCAARRSTRSGAGTSATSCTSRTPTCAGGSAARAGTSRTNRAAVVHHEQGAITAQRPYRMLLEHHRSAWRFAQKPVHRRRTWFCCPFAAVFLAVRVVLAVAARRSYPRAASSRAGRRGPTTSLTRRERDRLVAA